MSIIYSVLSAVSSTLSLAAASSLVKNGGTGAPMAAAFSATLPGSVRIYHTSTTGSTSTVYSTGRLGILSATMPSTPSVRAAATTTSSMPPLCQMPARAAALENLRYFSLMFGIQSPDYRKILEMVGLQKAENKKARQFSLGMKQRLGIAISLLGNPDFLILDEPINGLDPEGVYEMRKMLEMLNCQYGTTIMIASHILSELYKLATDYAIIDGGCLIDEFSKETLESACSSGVQVTVEP